MFKSIQSKLPWEKYYDNQTRQIIPLRIMVKSGHYMVLQPLKNLQERIKNATREPSIPLSFLTKETKKKKKLHWLSALFSHVRNELCFFFPPKPTNPFSCLSLGYLKPSSWRVFYLELVSWWGPGDGVLQLGDGACWTRWLAAVIDMSSGCWWSRVAGVHADA